MGRGRGADVNSVAHAARATERFTYRVDNGDDLLEFVGTDVGTMREAKVEQQPLAEEVFVRRRFAGVVDQLPVAADVGLAEVFAALLFSL